MPIIAIEGLDGCGKTTQVALLAERLQRSGFKTKHVRAEAVIIECIYSVTRLNIERFLPSPRKRRTEKVKETKRSLSFAVSSLLMGVAGYIYSLLSYVIIAFYSRKYIVVCDRFFYQLFYDLYGKSSDKIAKYFPRPDIGYFLEASLEVCYSRMSEPHDRKVSERYYSRINELLVRLSRKHGFISIQADQDPAQISDYIYKDVVGRLKL